MQELYAVIHGVLLRHTGDILMSVDDLCQELTEEIIQHAQSGANGEIPSNVQIENIEFC